jgi:glutamate 5-kinase
MNKLLELKVLPIINENDTVNTDEISVGDNDTLGAIVAVSMHADLLVLLSDIDGLYTADPHTNSDAKIIEEIEEITPEIEALGGKSQSGLGTGGMATKISAAKRCVARGTDVIIANGSAPAVLYKIIDGEKVGTRFKAVKK